MFSTAKLYIIGIGTALIGVLYAIIKYQSSKIEKIEEENASFEKKEVITDKMEAAQRQSEALEEKKQAAIDSSNWRNKI